MEIMSLSRAKVGQVYWQLPFKSRGILSLGFHRYDANPLYVHLGHSASPPTGLVEQEELT